MKYFKICVISAIPVVITVLALLGRCNGSDAMLRQIAVSAVGIAAAVAIIVMRRKLPIMRIAPWALGCFDLAVVGLVLCGIYRTGAACWLLLGTIPFWVAWFRGKFTKIATGNLVVLASLAAIIVCNCLLLSDATRRSRLVAYVRGEELVGRTALVEEQSRWKQTMQDAAWFGATDAYAAPANTRTTHSVALLVDATQRHGKWLPMMMCALFLALSAIMVVPLIGDKYHCSVRLFGVLASLWLVAPVVLSVAAAYMLVPAVNVPIPFVACGAETVVAWVLVAMGSCVVGTDGAMWLV